MKIKHFMACLLINHLLVVSIITKAQVTLKICSRDKLLSCPSNSLCSLKNINDENDTPKCVCLESFQLNPSWREYENLNTSTFLVQEHYCLASDEIAKSKENKLLVYMRLPARKEHLAFGILMVLLAGALATAVLYGLKALNPVKRTKLIYRKLKYNRRQNITPLQEMDELEFNRQYEMQIL